MQEAWNLVNDSLRVPICIRFRTATIACACIHLAARRVSVPMPENPPWWQIAGAAIVDMEEIALEILSLYTLPKPVYISVNKGETAKTVDAGRAALPEEGALGEGSQRDGVRESGMREGPSPSETRDQGEAREGRELVTSMDGAAEGGKGGSQQSPFGDKAVSRREADACEDRQHSERSTSRGHVRTEGRSEEPPRAHSGRDRHGGREDRSKGGSRAERDPLERERTSSKDSRTAEVRDGKLHRHRDRERVRGRARDSKRDGGRDRAGGDVRRRDGDSGKRLAGDAHDRERERDRDRGLRDGGGDSDVHVRSRSRNGVALPGPPTTLREGEADRRRAGDCALELVDSPEISRGSLSSGGVRPGKRERVGFLDDAEGAELALLKSKPHPRGEGGRDRPPSGTAGHNCPSSVAPLPGSSCGEDVSRAQARGRWGLNGWSGGKETPAEEEDALESLRALVHKRPKPVLPPATRNDDRAT
jgi:hypothetical protein